MSVITPTPIPIHPYSGQQGWITLPQLAHQIVLLTPANEGPSRKALHFLRTWCCKSTHARLTQTRSLFKGVKPSVHHKMLHKIPRTDQGRHCWESDKWLFLEKYECHLRRKEKCHALPHRFDIQPKACHSVQPYTRPTNLPHLPKARRHLPHAVSLQSSHY